MIKGLVLCFAFLFAQLFALHYIDSRLNGGSREARPAADATPPVHRAEEETEHNASV